MRFDNFYVIVLFVIMFCIVMIFVNVVVNIVLFVYDIVNVLLKYINFKCGSFIIVLFVLFIVLWKLMESVISVYVFFGLIGGMFGLVVGVMMVDYFIVCKCEFLVDDLYFEIGWYVYCKGYNYCVFVVMILGVFILLIGMYVFVLKSLYDIFWFVGVLILFFFYIVLMCVYLLVLLVVEMFEIG